MTAQFSSTSNSIDLNLQARDLACVRGERTLFANIHFELSAGEGLHVRGENGVGKTSLLRLLSGLSKPDAGQVLWNHESITKQANQYRTELLFLGHRDALKEELTALENLQIYAALDGITLPVERALAALWRFGLRGRENLSVNCLSAGQKRRVLMARMLTRQARLWILDEPFNALDVNAVAQLEELLVEHLRSGGLLVLTSHQAVNISNMRVLDL
jgi:heme exporter protein A